LNNPAFSAHCPAESPEFIAFQEECRKHHHHFELLEQRENSKHYKTVYGVDVATEIQNALRANEIKSMFQLGQAGRVTSSLAYNTSLSGYLALASFHNKDHLPTHVHLANKFDTVANGKHFTGYAWLKHQQLSKINERFSLDH